jgi:hypothetical protein
MSSWPVRKGAMLCPSVVHYLAACTARHVCSCCVTLVDHLTTGEWGRLFRAQTARVCVCEASAVGTGK